MSKLLTSSIAAALGFLGLAMAHAQQTPPTPSTSETEGTAADRTPPGETPTQAPQPQPSEQEAMPSTSETEGTAADRTAPGDRPAPPEANAPGTSSQGMTGKERMGGQGSEIVGAAVVAPGNAPLGKVVDVVFDSMNQPEFVVISSEGKATAVPYSVASSMRSADKIVIDRSKLQGAPKVKQGEWKSGESNVAWKKESERYWERG